DKFLSSESSSKDFRNENISFRRRTSYRNYLLFFNWKWRSVSYSTKAQGI
ncbi:hypothetical protein DOY81_003726, partial [Sarcophaga bullata]